MSSDFQELECLVICFILDFSLQTAIFEGYTCNPAQSESLPALFLRALIIQLTRLGTR